MDWCSCNVKCTEIILRATQTRDVLDEKDRQSCDLTSVVEGRFGFPVNSVKHFVQKPRTVLVVRHRRNLLHQTFQWCRCSSNSPRYRRIHFERMARKSVDCEVLISGKWHHCAISMMSKDGHTNFTQTANSSMYSNDKSRIAVPVKPCV